MNIYVGNITEIDEVELNVTFTKRFSNVVGCYRWPTRLDELCVVYYIYNICPFMCVNYASANQKKTL